MHTKPPRWDKTAKRNLGTIEGTRDELTLLRDALDRLLTHSEGDTRRHTQVLQVSDQEGWLVRKAEG